LQGSVGVAAFAVDAWWVRISPIMQKCEVIERRDGSLTRDIVPPTLAAPQHLTRLRALGWTNVSSGIAKR